MLAFDVQSAQWSFERGALFPLNNPGIREIAPANPQLDGNAPATYANAPDPNIALQTDITNLYVNYARQVLNLLDMLPGRSVRGRLLNALEVVSGKLMADGQSDAAATILGEEATRFRDNVQECTNEWKTAVFNLITARRHVRPQNEAPTHTHTFTYCLRRF
ncbi:MAG: hypothetical protein HYX68_06695 [Planctomycetes bacterium]|nr:hypothetical protein [Planctomycetota bacterium]